MALVQKAFSDIITFSRSSNATRIGPTGLVEYAPHNLLQRSEEFDNAYWSVARATITANSLAAPNGTVTADSLVEDTTSNSHVVFRTVSGFVVQPYTVSVYMKSATRTKARIAFASVAFPSSPYLDIDFSAVTVSGVNGASGTITSVGGGWYRCTATVTAGAAGNGDIYFQPRNDAGSASYLGNGLTALYLWGAQLSVGPYALDYTPTTSAAVYGPRFDFDPVTLAARGLLVEESRTNLLTYSEDYSNAAWTKTNSTVTANSATSPDGTVTADLISGTGAGQNITQTVTANGTQQTLSFFVKKPSSGVFSGATLLFYNLTTTSVIALANFSGETFTVNATTGTATSTAYGNGWYRITLTNSSGLSSGNLLTCYLYPDNLSGASNANDTVLAWGAQCE